jgi:hypothetical protein
MSSSKVGPGTKSHRDSKLSAAGNQDAARTPSPSPAGGYAAERTGPQWAFDPEAERFDYGSHADF